MTASPCTCIIPRIKGAEVFEGDSSDPETGRTEIIACATVIEEMFLLGDAGG
jgi:hypothetical protein